MERERLLGEFFERMSSMRRLFYTAHTGGVKGTPTRAQLAVMAMVAHEIHSVKEIAQHFGMTSSAITQVVNGLVKDQLITRTLDPTDRRKVSLTLTKQGQTALTKSHKSRHAMMSKMLSPLTDSEIRQLRAMQEKIITHLNRV